MTTFKNFKTVSFSFICNNNTQLTGLSSEQITKKINCVKVLFVKYKNSHFLFVCVLCNTNQLCGSAQQPELERERESKTRTLVQKYRLYSKEKIALFTLWSKVQNFWCCWYNYKRKFKAKHSHRN